MKKYFERWWLFLTNYNLWEFHFKQIWQVLRDGGLSNVGFLILSKFFPAKQFGFSYARWFNLYGQISGKQLKKLEEQSKNFQHQPLISILLVINKPTEIFLKEAIVSVGKQIYTNWELCIAGDISTSSITGIINFFKLSEKKIKLIPAPIDNNDTSTLNLSLNSVAGEYITLLDENDFLAPDALYQVVKELNSFPKTNLFYSDEDKVDAAGRHFDPYFKTDLNPLLLLSINYVGHLIVYRTSIIRELGFANYKAKLAQYDLLLRYLEKIEWLGIRHLPYLLYHCRMNEKRKPDANLQKEVAAATAEIVQAHLRRQNITANLLKNPWLEFAWRPQFQLNRTPKITIILPTRDRVDLLRMSVDSLLNSEKTEYDNFELIIVNNDSKEQATYTYFEQISVDPRVKILAFNEPFNWSRINNFAIETSSSELVLLFNNDIKAINKNWLQEMTSYMLLNQVGIVGAKLYYPNETLQHGGVILGLGGVAGHILAGIERTATGYCNSLVQVSNYAAVTGACMLVKRKVLEELQGFDENLTVAFNDIDFCVRAVKAGYQIIFTPFAELYHYESATRGKRSDLSAKHIKRFKNEIAYMQNKHGNFLLDDPFYNPNFSLMGNQYNLAFPPRRQRV